MKKITIIYYSRTGNTEIMAKAVKEGAEKSGAEATLKKAEKAGASDVLNCDAVIFGSPNYFGYMAGAVQMILEDCFMELAEEDVTRPYAVFASAGSQGGREPIENIERLCDGFGKRFGKFKFSKAADGVGTPPSESTSPGPPSEEVLEKCRELGKRMALLE